jgi:hypothetical protein
MSAADKLTAADLVDLTAALASRWQCSAGNARFGAHSGPSGGDPCRPALHPLETVALRSACDLKIDTMNGWEAQEDGLWLKAWNLPKTAAQRNTVVFRFYTPPHETGRWPFTIGTPCSKQGAKKPMRFSAAYV